MTSSPPPSGMMKPKALSANHILTTPVFMLSGNGGGGAAPPHVCAAPNTFFAVIFDFPGSQPSSHVTCAPTTNHCPSARSLRCTKTSSPPPLGVRKPMPLSSTQAFTTPLHLCRLALVAVVETASVVVSLVGTTAMPFAPSSDGKGMTTSSTALVLAGYAELTAVPVPISKLAATRPLLELTTGRFTKHFMAMRFPFVGSHPSSNVTRLPSCNDWESQSPLLWMKTSSPPFSGLMKPIPRSSYQALTTPGCMPGMIISSTNTSCCFAWHCAPPKPLGTLILLATALPFPSPVKTMAPAPLPSAATAPVTFLAILFPFIWSHESSNMTCEPTTSHWPSTRELRCTNASSPPFAGDIKPMPLSSFHVLTIPDNMWPTVLVGRPETTSVLTPPLPLPPFVSAGAAPDTFFATLLFLA
mmetsp:Transcript_73029/g.144789  ORF Transcript_73029/g.144789 Transcript_73029/m.144789 type:complete len:414 (-) Transcript_73029:318-1559(-)